MRIAVSGTHCTGKSTLIDEFLRAHPDFVHEPEPYTVLVEEFGEEFSAEPCVEDFLRQLEFNIDRLKQHARGERVIYERCPLDFVAYIECISRDSNPLDSLVAEAVEAIQNLDVMVYLPIDANIDVSDEEFPKLRKSVDRRLSAIYVEDVLGIISNANVVIVEATGPIEQRLRTLEAAMKPSQPTESLFTYGTLRNEEVQLDVFGRTLAGHADALPGYTLKMIEVHDHDFVIKSGTAIHRNLQFTGDPLDFVEGTVYSVTLQELEQADSYEPAGYKRALVQLRSGANAWVYLDKETYGNTD
jgi:hypothetical protein